MPGCRVMHDGRMLTMRAIGTVRSPFTETTQIPKGCGARHEAEGDLDILAAFEAGLADIEGFSHLYVIWVFDRVTDFDLTAWPPSDDRPHGVFATRSPRRPNPIGLTVVRLLSRRGRHLHVAGLDMLDGSPILWPTLTRSGSSRRGPTSARSLFNRIINGCVSGSPKRQLNSSTFGPFVVSISPA